MLQDFIQGRGKFNRNDCKEQKLMFPIKYKERTHSVNVKQEKEKRNELRETA